MLKALLNSIPVPKYIFTNADLKHAEKCLDILGLGSCFQGIICFESIMAEAEKNGIVHHNKPVICKPNRQAFDLALKQAGGAEAANTAFFDDSTRNIASSHRLGIYSVLVGRVGVDCPSDVQMRSIHDLPELMPWLFAVGDGRPIVDIKVGTIDIEEFEETTRTAVPVQA